MTRRVKTHSSRTAVVTVESLENRILLDGNGLEAVLTGAGNALGKAEFKIEDGERSFEVEVLRGGEGLYGILVAGESVGQITVNGAGLGKMELTDFPKDPDEFAFPPNWPGVDVGTAVSIIGLASGTIDQQGNDDAVLTLLTADLSGGGVAVGHVEYEVELEDGVESREFEVQAYNLNPNSEFPLLINGTTVATVSSSALGTVRLRYSDRVRPRAISFPADFPALTADSVVGIGVALSGTLMIPTDGQITENGEHLRISLARTGDESGMADHEIIRDASGATVREEFRVEVWNADAGTSFDVIVDGIHVGTIVADQRGFGKLHFESNDPEKPFPGNWPGIDSGSVVTAGETLTGVFSGGGRSADPSTKNQLDAYEIDRTENLRVAGSLFENWGGKGEKWVLGRSNVWYFMTPDGALYKWNGGTTADGSLVTILDSAFHSDPSLLHDAAAVRNLGLDDDLLRTTAAELDAEFELETPPNQYEDWGGRGEKWIRGRNEWFFITPDGTLTKWDRTGAATGTLVSTFDPRFHEDTRLLSEGLSRLSDEESAFALDSGLTLRSPPNDFFDWGGRREKWILAAENWLFILPDGSIHVWNRSNAANGPKLTTISTAFYDDPTLLTSPAQPNISDAARSVLDDVFVDLDFL